jgi:hypothetical protein
LPFNSASDAFELHPDFALYGTTLSKNGTEDHRLPTAHTCFNHLLLPEYKDEGTLRARLTQAIENAEGFGLQ